MKLKSTLLLMTLALTSSITLAGEGTNSGGGGNVLGERAKVDRNAVATIFHDIRSLKPVFYGLQQQLFAPGLHVEITNPIAPALSIAVNNGLTKSDQQRLFTGSGNLFDLIEAFGDRHPTRWDNWELKDNEDCFDPNDVAHRQPKDASASGSGSQGTICVSISRLAKDTTAGQLRLKMLALMAHELTHLILGADERKAQAIQQMVELSLAQSPNFAAMQTLQGALLIANSNSTQKLKAASAHWKTGQFQTACGEIRDASQYGYAVSQIASTMNQMGVGQMDVKHAVMDQINRLIFENYLLVACTSADGFPKALSQENGYFEGRETRPASEGIYGAHYEKIEGSPYDLRPFLDAHETEPVLMLVKSVSDSTFGQNLEQASTTSQKLSDWIENDFLPR